MGSRDHVPWCLDNLADEIKGHSVRLALYPVDGGRISMFDEPQSGDVGEVDCVDMYKQPAFDHHLLKNHKIQMNPSFSTRRKTNEDFLKSQLVGFRCPQGMVPIRRPKTGLKSFSKSHGGSLHTFATKLPGEYSVGIETTEDATYHGAKAVITINNPRVEVGQYSKAQIWVRHGPDAETNSIEVGWAVHPKLYGDNRTRLTAYWTADGFQKTGCYNTECPGFVQVHNEYHLGGYFANISVFDGPQYGFKMTIIQDQETGNWWLMDDDDYKYGYWPKEIFTHLATGASYLRYGGATFSPSNIQTPVPMGNGNIPDIKADEAGTFTFVQFMNADYQIVELTDKIAGHFFDYGPNCYGVVMWSDGQDPNTTGYAFTYGGPGGPCQD
ncbi:protein neprosin-like [Corylus avellana]|uniref:protein neprosin-like n=1 Tax=Corylus avellana TaxID=13451 RepID=UPI00286A0424|nr:protein neprosin-like [Corylus avellana]